MNTQARDNLRAITDFDSLVDYLRDKLDWPIEETDFEDLTFDYGPEELGIDEKNAAKIEPPIKQLRPLSGNQPWGIFFVKFEPKRLPVVALRRILSRLVLKKRRRAEYAEQASWQLHDLLFILNFGEAEQRQMTFAHFSENPATGDLPTLHVLGWDAGDTALHIDHVDAELHSNMRWPDDETDLETWRERWSAAFTLRHREVITTSKKLAVELAKIAQRIRRRVNAVLAIEDENGAVRKLMASFKEALIHDLSEDDFADMYAQTISYGLLSARVSRPAGLVADDLVHMTPVTNPFLKELLETFLNVSGRKKFLDFDELGVNEVVHLLREANMEAVLRDFGDTNPQEDPVIHFYELFLKEYDAKKRMQRGVFYTPRPVVSFIVRSVDEILRTEFGLADGLADTATWGEMAQRHKDLQIPKGADPDQCFVQILDPATGTGTFLVEVIDLIHKTLTAKWQKQGKTAAEMQQLWNDYVPKYLLPRLHGYELLMAPYAIAHMKIGLKLAGTGYRFGSEERVRVYLTNALEPAQDFSDRLGFMVPALAHEADSVNEVKREQRFTVVIGNPPYSKMSGNLGPAAVKLVKPFRFVRGERIVEKGALALELNLQDDYVKFWGLLCATLASSGIGVASYITNSRYLASPTLRGLRAYICDHFSQGFFLDLGGQVSERRSLGTNDENVFDIEQGVSVGAVVSISSQGSMDSVFYERLPGKRASKYHKLGESKISYVQNTIPLSPPMFRFSRTNDETDKEFESWPALDRLMPFNSGSIITSRDNLAIDFDQEKLLEKIDRFATSARGDHSVLHEIGFSVKAKWDVERCKEEIRNIGNREKYIRTVLYRPFDFRYLFYLPSLIDTPSKPVCESVFNTKNLVLLTPGVKTSPDFAHVLVSRFPAEKKACSHDRATQMFPLYSYTGSLLNSFESNIGKQVQETTDEEAVFCYFYAVLHSPTYRSRYGSALRDSYPRIPCSANTRLFEAMSRLGAELVSLHLLESPKLDNFITTLVAPQPCEGFKPSQGFEFRVEKVSYSDETVWLDKAKTTGFRGVPEEVWNFHIGGYQVCEKWLKDRQAKGGKHPRPGRVLTPEDLAHYQKIVVALKETIRLTQAIDEVIDQHGGWPGAFVTK